MKHFTILFLFYLLIATNSLSQIPPDRTALLNGDETDNGRVASITGYPSPKSVLNVASALKLSEIQRNAIREIYDDAISRAKELGKQIVKIEDELHEALRDELVNERSLSDDAQQIGRLRGRLRGVFLISHLKTRRILSASQIDMWKKLTTESGKK